MYNSGRLLWTSSKAPLDEERSKGSTDSSSGGQGAVFILQQALIDNLKLFRKIFGRSCRQGLSNAAKANMSVNTLARQRMQLDDAVFDSN